MKTIAWFSCGATSAVACKIALSLYDDVEIYYIDTGSAHEDNVRFMCECEKWFGKKIHWKKNPNYFNVIDVIGQTCFINSPFGAMQTAKTRQYSAIAAGISMPLVARTQLMNG